MDTRPRILFKKSYDLGYIEWSEEGYLMHHELESRQFGFGRRPFGLGGFPLGFLGGLAAGALISQPYYPYYPPYPYYP